MSVHPHVAAVREYWENTHAAYLESVGTTFQAGRLRFEDRELSAASSNQHLAAAAGIRAGDLVLDAGCGVCGPAIDIARSIERLRIIGITISPEQAQTAKRLISDAGLNQVIEATLGDYHALPFRNNLFDVVYFFESAGYSYDLRVLFEEVWRLLRPGGRLYIKDVFRREGELSDEEQADLTKFNDVFAFRSPSLAEAAGALGEVGFTDIQARNITPEMSARHAFEAMFQTAWGLKLSRFGAIHFRIYRCLPLLFGEIKATRRYAARRPPTV